MIRSPIKWAGGKFRIRNRIIELIPDHNCYVEVFGGAGWVMFGKPPSSVEIFNDIDGELVNFFSVVKNKPRELINSFDLELVSREKFYKLRDLPSNELSNWTDVQRAHRFYYLIMASWGGELGFARFQTSVSDNGSGNRLIGAINTLEQRIMPAYERLQTVIIENLPWEICIERYDRPYGSNKVVMYLDPPYPGNRVNYQFNMKDIHDHRRLATILEGLGARFLLTSYNLDEVKELFNHDRFNILEVEFSSGMRTNGKSNYKNKEIIVTNFDVQK